MHPNIIEETLYYYYLPQSVVDWVSNIREWKRDANIEELLKEKIEAHNKQIDSQSIFSWGYNRILNTVNKIHNDKIETNGNLVETLLQGFSTDTYRGIYVDDNAKKNTLLHITSQKGNSFFYRYLITSASIPILRKALLTKNSEGMTPLSILIRDHQNQLIEETLLLCDKEATLLPQEFLINVVERDNRELIQLFFDKLSYPLAVDEAGNTMLQYANKISRQSLFVPIYNKAILSDRVQFHRQHVDPYSNHPHLDSSQAKMHSLESVSKRNDLVKGMLIPIYDSGGNHSIYAIKMLFENDNENPFRVIVLVPESPSAIYLVVTSLNNCSTDFADMDKTTKLQFVNALNRHLKNYCNKSANDVEVTVIASEQAGHSAKILLNAIMETMLVESDPTRLKAVLKNREGSDETISSIQNYDKLVYKNQEVLINEARASQRGKYPLFAKFNELNLYCINAIGTSHQQAIQSSALAILLRQQGINISYFVTDHRLGYNHLMGQNDIFSFAMDAISHSLFLYNEEAIVDKFKKRKQFISNGREEIAGHEKELNELKQRLAQSLTKEEIDNENKKHQDLEEIIHQKKLTLDKVTNSFELLTTNFDSKRLCEYKEETIEVHFYHSTLNEKDLMAYSRMKLHTNDKSISIEPSLDEKNNAREAYQYGVELNAVMLSAPETFIPPLLFTESVSMIDPLNWEEISTEEMIIINESDHDEILIHDENKEEESIDEINILQEINALQTEKDKEESGKFKEEIIPLDQEEKLQMKDGFNLDNELQKFEQEKLVLETQLLKEGEDNVNSIQNNEQQVLLEIKNESPLPSPQREKLEEMERLYKENFIKYEEKSKEFETKYNAQMQNDARQDLAEKILPNKKEYSAEISHPKNSFKEKIKNPIASVNQFFKGHFSSAIEPWDAVSSIESNLFYKMHERFVGRNYINQGFYDGQLADFSLIYNALRELKDHTDAVKTLKSIPLNDKLKVNLKHLYINLRMSLVNVPNLIDEVTQYDNWLRQLNFNIQRNEKVDNKKKHSDVINALMKPESMKLLKYPPKQFQF